ncbi:MAG: hypothetical protein A3J74_03515 [Elusimicrobia bacterium RIFCSPHIGHO2_02_FULL_57_9]|nr:MAG: hypothetical protein A3J74_03515 [Elusimicrobia bacterium RIFCSPHIGHO2_02_FULL_57_9]
MPKLSLENLKKRAKNVKVALMDIDGVLTNGVIFHFVDSRGKLVEFKGVNSQDSIALAWLADAGIKTGFISGRQSQGMDERLKLLKARYIYQGRLDKIAVFEEICRDAGVNAAQTLYIGDDLPDIPVLRAAGLAVAVSNARPEVKAAAHHVTSRCGGQGAVREVGEFLLREQGLWQNIMSRFAP